MNIKRFLIELFVACRGLSLTLRGFSGHVSTEPSSDSTSYDALDRYIEEQMHRLKMPGVSLAIVEGDKIVHLRGFGRARPNGEPPSPQTPFFICSLTKSFTALAVMQLVEAGKIDLDAPVQHYLPWFRVADLQASAQISVRHLLNQTSGLPTSAGEIPLANFDNRRDATERQVRALSTLVCPHPVGAMFAYSNANYNVLGLIIEAVSGELYADYIQKEIFAPLNMKHSYTSQAVAKENGLAMGHRYWFAIPFTAPDMPISYGSLPSGQLISSSEDMARYLIALLNGGRYGHVQLLSDAGIVELHRGVADFTVMGRSLGQYGMGWFVDKIDQTKLVWHSGTNPDFAAYMALVPEQKKGVVLLFNADHHWMTPVLSNFGENVAALLIDKEPDPVPFVDTIPWLLRGQLLIPALQVVDVVAVLQMLRCWRVDPKCRPDAGRKWGMHILLPLLPNLLVASTLMSMLGKRRGYLMRYMPDYSWISLICGSFASIWIFLRTKLVLHSLRKP